MGKRLHRASGVQMIRPTRGLEDGPGPFQALSGRGQVPNLAKQDTEICQGASDLRVVGSVDRLKDG